MSKISMITGNSTPEVFCAQLLENAKDIKHIACVVQYENETHVFSTTMKNIDIVWLRWIFNQDFKPEEY